MIANANGTSQTVLLGEKEIATCDYTNNQSNGFWDNSIYGGFAMGGTIRSESGVYRDSAVRLSSQDAWGAPFSGGCPFAMCDGSVRIWPYGDIGLAMYWWNKVPIVLP